MNLGTWFGVGLLFVGGLLQGTFAVPMKYARQWKHENIWFVFVLTGLVIFPWILTLVTVPSVAQVYSDTPMKALMLVVGFGIGWGVGATLTGVGLNMLGISLGFAIIIGLSASLGSLIPLLVLTPEKMATSRGHLYLVGTAIMLIAIGVVAVAGSIRERAEQASGGSGQTGGKRYLVGLVVAISAGILSSMLNFSYAFGSQLLEAARHLGASTVWAANVVAAPATSGGFLANFLYCAYMMRRNKSTSRLWSPGTAGHWLLGLTMGAFWFGGLALYGVGVVRMGTFGTVVGWPLLMGTIILSSNAAGLVTGEWKMGGRRAKAYLFAGCGGILIALLFLAMAQQG